MPDISAFYTIIHINMIPVASINTVIFYHVLLPTHILHIINGFAWLCANISEVRIADLIFL